MKIAFCKHVVNIFKETDCKLIGQKVDGIVVSPFLWIKIVQGFFKLKVQYVTSKLNELWFSRMIVSMDNV